MTPVVKRVYHQIEEGNEATSLLRFGHSKNHRPDLRQYRQLLGTLDPAGVPLVSETLAGNGADDPVYLPTWQRLVKVIGHKDFIYIADCKAAAHQTRAKLAKAGGRYCFPLPMTGHTPSLLKSWVRWSTYFLARDSLTQLLRVGTSDGSWL